VRLVRHRSGPLGESSLAQFEIIQGGKCDLAAESRDTERAIRLWHQKASNARPPDPSVFDFRRLGADWGYRFIISGDRVLGAAVFILYGLPFARLLGLPDKPNPLIPIMQQIPQRYRDLFREGCYEVLVQPKPTRFSGAVRQDADAELYRAAFMPLRSGDPARPLIFGTFNRRAVPLTALRADGEREHVKITGAPDERPRVTGWIYEGAGSRSAAAESPDPPISLLGIIGVIRMNSPCTPLVLGWLGRFDRRSPIQILDALRYPALGILALGSDRFGCRLLSGENRPDHDGGTEGQAESGF
jgi:hypothetical protein